MRPQFDAEAARRIGDAVRDAESRTAAELVVEIRARSGSYEHADARFAAALALVSLAVLVFMPWNVPPVAVLIDPIVVYAAGVVIARRSAAIRRLFTRPRERQQVVRTQAAALFFERGVANTTDETGLILYVSLLERRIEVLADRGVLRKVAPNDWNAALAALRSERPLDADAVIEAIRTLGAVLERAVPAEATNVDELPSAPGIDLQ
jgi:putative membrane protein